MLSRQFKLMNIIPRSQMYRFVSDDDIHSHYFGGKSESETCGVSLDLRRRKNGFHSFSQVSDRKCIFS